MRKLLPLLLALLPLGALAQSKIVIGFPFGGASDLIAREIATPLGYRVESIPGANGTLAAEHVANSKPDGKTLLFGTNSAMVAAFFDGTTVRYDPFKDFVPVSIAGRFRFFLVTSPDFLMHRPQDVVFLAKALKGRFNYGYTSSYALYAMRKVLDGAPGEAIPYKTDAPAMVDLLEGRIHALWTASALTSPLVREGKLVVLTTAETGEVQLDLIPWAGIFAPKDTPPEVVWDLSARIISILSTPAVIGKLYNLGFLPEASTPEMLGFLHRSQWNQWQQQVKLGVIP